MKHRILYISILLSLFATNCFSQSKPLWLINLEKTINQKERQWKIDNKINKVERFYENGFDYNLVLKSGQLPLAIQITRMNNLPNIEETFSRIGSIIPPQPLTERPRCAAAGASSHADLRARIGHNSDHQ